jgi:hypothetical protein
VQALSAQLHAVIKVTEGSPGTSVSVTHAQIAAIASDKVAISQAV